MYTSGPTYFYKLFLAGVCLGLLPLLFFVPEFDRYAEPGELLRFASIISGVAGLTFLALSAFSSLRHRWSENVAGGLDNLYRLHHIFAVIAFALIILHVSLLTFSYWLYSPAAAVDLFRLWEQPWEMVFGWLSLVLLGLVFLATAALKRYSSRWRIFHLLSLPAYLFALYHFHAFTIATGVGKWLLYVLFIGGFFAALLRSCKYLFSHRYRVTASDRLGEDVVRISLVAEGKPMRYKAGQFVFAAFHTAAGYSGCNEFHPFSITSFPEDEVLELMVKARGDCSCTLQHIVPSVPAHIEGPFGGRWPESSDQIWIGGGIGIAPFLSLLRGKKNRTGTVDIYYLTRSAAEHALLGQLHEAARQKPEVSIHAVAITKNAAELVSVMQKDIPDFRSRSFLLGGPPQMVHDVEGCLAALGIPRSAMYHESFGNV